MLIQISMVITVIEIKTGYKRKKVFLKLSCLKMGRQLNFFYEYIY